MTLIFDHDFEQITLAKISTPPRSANAIIRNK